MDNKEKLRSGFAGWGFIGPVHADGVALNWDIAVPYAVAEDDKSKHEMLLKKGLKVYGDAIQMIEDPEIDVVHITGPDRFHAEWALAAMNANKKVVVCEKPMTETLDDAVKVLEAAQKYEAEGGVFMTNINYMGHALPRAARELRQRDYLGKIELVSAVYEQDWLMDPNLWNWRLVGKMCASKDILPHLISAVYFMGGISPVNLSADYAVIVDERQRPKAGRTNAFGGGAGNVETEPVEMESDLYTSVMCDFSNGAKGNFKVTQYLAGRHNWWEITLGGSKRRITWNQVNPNEMEIGQNNYAPGENLDPEQVGNIKLINNPGLLAKMGLNDAKQYSPYPGEHPAGHIDAFAKNFRAAYSVARGEMPREQAVIPGAMIGFVCTAVADAVLRSRESTINVKVDYRGVEPAGKL